jgi:UDP-2,4-diacetamido-2,4,6-trideoxy-beta-L-altropyranose hydrolase
MSRPLAILRADASAGIGTGHVVRSTVLGGGLAAAGWDSTLVARDLPAVLASAAEASGVRFAPLPANLEAAAEASAISRAVGRNADLVVADHYDLGARWFEAMARANPGAIRMAIDDLANRPLPVDLLLNQNLGPTPDSYVGLVPAGAELLLGPRFALVRPAFAALRSTIDRRDGEIHRVLVFISGSDLPDVTGRACEALRGLELEVDVVVGPGYPHLPGLRALLEGERRFRLHVNTTRMPELMAAADLAIGAPGSASWERCTLGLPTILVTVADNQVEVARSLVELGAARSLGWHAEVAAADLRAAVEALRASVPATLALGRRAAAATDGLGVARVVAAIADRRAEPPRPGRTDHW